MARERSGAQPRSLWRGFAQFRATKKTRLGEARRSAAEDLVAQGFGTLRARPAAEQAVTAKGIYATDAYRVVFQRALTGPSESTVTLQAGSTVPVAFAVWNGSAGDRDGKKSVTIWQDLKIEP